MNGSPYLEAFNRIWSKIESEIKRLGGKLSAVDERLSTLEARAEKRLDELCPIYSMVFLTLGIAVFTGLLMWYLSKGTTDKILTGAEEVIKDGFKAFNDFLSMYLGIVQDRKREGTTTLVGSFSRTQKKI